MPPTSASAAFAMNICQPDAGGRGYIPLADHGLSVLHLPSSLCLGPRPLTTLVYRIGNLHTAALVCP